MSSTKRFDKAWEVSAGDSLKLPSTWSSHAATDMLDSFC